MTEYTSGFLTALGIVLYIVMIARSHFVYMAMEKRSAIKSAGIMAFFVALCWPVSLFVIALLIGIMDVEILGYSKDKY